MISLVHRPSRFRLAPTQRSLAQRPPQLVPAQPIPLYLKRLVLVGYRMKCIVV